MVVKTGEISENDSQTAARKYDRSGAAHYCGVSVVTIDRALARKHIAHFRVGRRVIFDRSHLDAFLKRNEVVAK